MIKKQRIKEKEKNFRPFLWLRTSLQFCKKINKTVHKGREDVLIYSSGHYWLKISLTLTTAKWTEQCDQSVDVRCWEVIILCLFSFSGCQPEFHLTNQQNTNELNQVTTWAWISADIRREPKPNSNWNVQIIYILQNKSQGVCKNKTNKRKTSQRIEAKSSSVFENCPHEESRSQLASNHKDTSRRCVLANHGRAYHHNRAPLATMHVRHYFGGDRRLIGCKKLLVNFSHSTQSVRNTSIQAFLWWRSPGSHRSWMSRAAGLVVGADEGDCWI